MDDDVVTREEKIGVSETRCEGGEELGGGAAEDHLAACAERGGLDAHDGLEDGVGAVDDGDGAVGRRVARAELTEGTAHVLANRVGDGGGGLGPAGVLHQGPAVEEGGETRADRGEAGGATRVKGGGGKRGGTLARVRGVVAGRGLPGGVDGEVSGVLDHHG